MGLTSGHWLDDAALGLAEGSVSRREVLRRGGVLAAGAMLGGVGGSLAGFTPAASAKLFHCKDGHGCRLGESCCGGDCCDDKTEQCCGGSCISINRLCCGDKNPCGLHDKACCGRSAKCVPEGHGCCRETVYDNATQGCCMGELYDKREKKCCLAPDRPDLPPNFLCDVNQDCCVDICCEKGKCPHGTCLSGTCGHRKCPHGQACCNQKMETCVTPWPKGSFCIGDCDGTPGVSVYCCPTGGSDACGTEQGESHPACRGEEAGCICSNGAFCPQAGCCDIFGDCKNPC